MVHIYKEPSVVGSVGPIDRMSLADTGYQPIICNMKYIDWYPAKCAKQVNLIISAWNLDDI